MKNVLVLRMPEHPNLEQLKRQAKELLQQYFAGEAEAVARVNAHYRAAGAAKFALHDAQLVIARSYGFESWRKLKAYVDGITIRRLMEAVGANALETVRAMLASRPELVNLSLSYGDERRPIHEAVMKRLPAMTRLLMQHGADARQGIHPHRDATTAWMLASDREYHEILAAIEEEERRRPAERRVETQAGEDDPLRRAVIAGDIDWLRTRQTDDALRNPIRWSDGGLLTCAVEHNQVEILRMLLDCGFDPDEHIASGEGDWAAHSQGYPLWHAAALGRREMAEILLDYGADPNVHVDSSGSAVYSAYSHKQWEMVELLRSRGGIVTADIAAIYRQTNLARQMLADNADSKAVEELLHFGASGGSSEIVRMALERITWPREDSRWFRVLAQPLSFWHHIPWLYAGNRAFDRDGYLACFRQILARADPNVAGGFGRTLLHEVAAMGDHVAEEEAAAFTQALLEAGAKTEMRDSILQSTPLGWACRWGRVQVSQLLIAHGADTVEANAEPWATPKAWARKKGHERCLVHQDRVREQ